MTSKGMKRAKEIFQLIPCTCELWTVYHAILSSWGMERYWIKSLLLLMSSSLGFFNKVSKQTLLSSSFDSLRSHNVYMSLPRHFTCLSFILPLMMAICGAQDRVWSLRHTCATYIAKSKIGSTEKIKSYNQIKMCTCMDCNGWNGNSFCMISLPI